MVLTILIFFLFFRFNIFKAEHIHRTLFRKHKSDNTVSYQRYIDLNDNTFSFARFCQLEVIELERITLGGLIYLYVYFFSLLVRNLFNHICTQS